MHMYMHTHRCTHIQRHTHSHTRRCTHTHTRRRTHTQAHTHSHTRRRTHTQAHTHSHTRRRTHTQTHTCMYIYLINKTEIIIENRKMWSKFFGLLYKNIIRPRIQEYNSKLSYRS